MTSFSLQVVEKRPRLKLSAPYPVALPCAAMKNDETPSPRREARPDPTLAGLDSLEEEVRRKSLRRERWRRLWRWIARLVGRRG